MVSKPNSSTFGLAFILWTHQPLDLVHPVVGPWPAPGWPGRTGRTAEPRSCADPRSTEGVPKATKTRARSLIARLRSLPRNERPLSPRGMLRRMAASKKLDRQEWVGKRRSAISKSVVSQASAHSPTPASLASYGVDTALSTANSVDGGSKRRLLRDRHFASRCFRLSAGLRLPCWRRPARPPRRRRQTASQSPRPRSRAG